MNPPGSAPRGARPIDAGTIVTAVVCALAITAACAWGARWWPAYGLRLTVYDTPTWQGHRLLETTDASLSDELLGAAPFPSLQVYSAEWNGYLAVSEAGDYGFRTRSDDGSSVEIAGVLVVDNLGEHALREVTGAARMTAGLHPIRVRYFQAAGRYSVNVLWAPPGRPFEPIPRQRLVADATTWPDYQLRWAPTVVATGLALLTIAALLVLGARLRVRLPRRVATLVAWSAAQLERPTVAVTAIVATGALARLAVLLTTPAIVWPDSHVFYVTVRDIVGGYLASHDAYRTLVYPYFLAAFIGWHDAPAMGTVVMAVQQALGLASCVAFYVVGRHAFRPLVAFAGAWLLAVHGPQLFYEASVLTETLFTFVLSLTLWLALRLHDTPTLRRAVVLGLAAALLVLVRPVAQWFVLCLLGVALVARGSLRQRRLAAALVAVCYALPLAGWMLVNQHEYGFFGIALGRGMGLYTRVFEIDALAPPASSRDPELRELWTTSRTLRWSPNRVRDELDYGRGLSSAAADDRMYAFALETIAAHPIGYATGSVRQWMTQVAAPDSGIRACGTTREPVLCSGRNNAALPPFPGTIPDGAVGLRRAVVRYVVAGPFNMAAVAALALLGLAVLVVGRGRSVAGMLVVASTLYFTAVPALSQVAQDRFRLPIDGLLFMLAACGLLAALEALRQWEARRI